MKKLMFLLAVLLFVASAVAGVSDGESIRQYFACNGSITEFTFTQPVNSADDILVYNHIIATGDEGDPLIEDTDYTIASTGNNYLNGGVVTISPALEATSRVVIVRNIKKSQETSTGAMSAAAAVLALDKLTRITQDLQDRNDRSWHLQESDGTDFNMEIPGIEERKSKFPFFNDSGQLTYVTDAIPGDVVVSPFMATVLDEVSATDAMAELQGVSVINVTNSGYGATGDGSTDDETAIELAIEAAAVDGGTVFFPSTGNAYKFLAAITVPSNVTLQFAPGASIMGDGSSVLTINGRVADTRHQIFQSTMTATGLSWASTAWWGAVGDGDSDSAATNAAAIQAAIDSLVDAGVLLIPADTDTMYFDTGILFNIERGTFDCQVELIYTGDSGAAWTVGTGAVGGNIDMVTGRIKTLTRSTQDWTDTVSGFRFDGCRAGYFIIGEIEDFTYNIELFSSNLNNNYHNELHIGYSRDAKIHVYFNADEGRMNRNAFYGPKCRDNGNAVSYVGSYGILIPREDTNQTNNNKFYDLAFEWTTKRLVTNNIFCGGRFNTFYSPSQSDGGCADVEIRFHGSATANLLLLATGASGVVYDPSGNNTIRATDYTTFNGVKFSHLTDVDKNFFIYSAGDRWMNNDYDAITDSEGEIALTAGSFWPEIAETASTTSGSAEVTISAEPSSISVGIYINIAGVTGPFQVIARDAVTDTITLDATADATVGAGAITIQEPTFSDGLDPYFSSIELGHASDTTLARTGAGTAAIEGDQIVTESTLDVTEKTGFALLSSTTVAMGANNTKANLFTVPTGKRCIVTRVIIHTLSSAVACGTNNSFGIGSPAADWRDSINLSSLDATSDYWIATPPTTDARITFFYSAADVFGIQTDIGGSASAVNAVVDVFGYLY